MDKAMERVSAAWQACRDVIDAAIRAHEAKK